MKHVILPLTLAALVALPHSGRAEGNQTLRPQPPAEQSRMEQLPAMLEKLQVMRNQVTGEKDPATRKNLIRRHLEIMQEGMKMMADEPGGVVKRSEQTKANTPALEDRLAMLEKKQALMEKMLLQTAMVSGQELMPGELLNETPLLTGTMMGGLGMAGGPGMTPGGMREAPAAFTLERRLELLERQVLTMREIITGLVQEQSLLLQ